MASSRNPMFAKGPEETSPPVGRFSPTGTRSSEPVTRYCKVTPSPSGIGVHLHESEDGQIVRIDMITPGGQADLAGLCALDEVVSIAGLKAAGNLQGVLQQVAAITQQRPTEPIEWIVSRDPGFETRLVHMASDMARCACVSWTIAVIVGSRFCY